MGTGANADRGRGFSLVELMVAMAIGVILMAAVYQFFISQSRTYSVQDDVNRMQQDARVASTMITKAVQQTGAFAPTVGSTVSLRGQVILAATDHYLVLQADDPYRPADGGIITADEVIAFAVSSEGGATTERIGDDPAVTNKVVRTARVFYDQDTPPDGVDADEGVDLEVPLSLAGPPYTLFRITPDPAGGVTPVFEEIAGNVDNFVLRYYDQNGDRIFPIDQGTGNPLPPFQPLGATERALVRSVEMELTLRTRNTDPRFAETFALGDNTVGTYDTGGNPRTAFSFVDDGFRRRTFTARISPRNLSANSCGRITIVANPGQVPCSATSSSAITAALFDQFGDPVVNQPTVFQLDPSTGASFVPLPTVTTTTTATTDANGEVTVPVYYLGLTQALSVSAAAEVDCRPTGPQRFTLQNAVSVGFGPGFADRIQITNLPTADVDRFQSTGTGCTPETWTFEVAGFDLCGNPAAEDPALPFQFEVTGGGTIASDTLDSATKVFTVDLPGPGVAGLSSDLWLSSGAGLGVPSEIQVNGVAQTPPYAAALYPVTLHPWPPVDIVTDPVTWPTSFAPIPPATVHQDCADTTVLTSGTFALADCATNPVTEDLVGGGFGYQLVPTLTGPGTLAVVNAVPTDYALEYTMDGCSTPPGGSFAAQAGVELQDAGGTMLDDEGGKKDILVEGCATCSVQVIKNPTPCDLRGTVEISGCDMAGKSIEVVLTTTSGSALASFSPPLTPRVTSYPYTFPGPSTLPTASLVLDVYVTRANVGDQIAVTAYYPNASSNFWSCAGTMGVDTHCESLRLYADNGFAFPIETGGAITCLEEVKEIHARVKDCQSSAMTNPSREVTIDLYADGTLYDRERIDLVGPDPSDPDYLICDTTKHLLVSLDDGRDVFWNDRLTYPAGKTIRLVSYYYDPADNEFCVEVVDDLVSPASMCFFNALASGADADLPPNIQVHWGDVVVEGTADLKAAASASMNKRSSATLTSGTSDRFLDVYVGQDGGGSGGYYITSLGDTSADGFRPFLISDDMGNYFQHVSNIGIQTLAPDLDYDALRSFARARTTQPSYWHAVSGVNCPDGPQLANFGGTTTACLSAVLAGPAPFLFIDTFGTLGSPPSGSGIDIDAAPVSGPGALPAWTIGDIFTGNIPQRVIYIAGSVTFTSSGGGSALALPSPPQQDVHYNDNPLPGSGTPAWSPSEVDLPIEFDTAASPATINIPGVNVRAGLYLDGQATFDGSPVIFGSLVAERGVEYLSGNPEIWYDHDLRGASTTTCSQCGTRPVTGCSMSVSPASLNFSNPLDWAHLNISGTLGLVSSSVDDPAIASFSNSSGWAQSLDVGTTAIRLSDSLQPACAVAVPVNVGCNPGLAAGNPSLTMAPPSNFTFATGAGSLLWSIASGTAVTLSGGNPSSFIGVNAARVGSADISGAFLGTSCADSLAFSVGCGLTASITSGTPPGNVLFTGGPGISLQAAFASGGVDRWEQAPPGTPALSIADGGSTATVSLSGTPSVTAPATVNVFDVDGCQAGVGLVVCPLEINAGPGSMYLGETLPLSVSGDSGSGAAWSCTPSGGGSVSLSTTTGSATDLTGLAAGTVTCRAEDLTYPTCYAETTVTVLACPTAVAPTTASVRAGDAPVALSATGFPGNVTWSQASGDGGAVSIAAGSAPFWNAQVAGTSPGTVTVTATDPGLPTCPASSTVTVTPACVDLIIPSPLDGASYGTDTANGASLVWEGIPDDLDGGDPLNDINRVFFRATHNGTGTVEHTHDEGASGYCAFGGNTCATQPGDVSGWPDGTYTLEVWATTDAGHPCGAVTSITRSVQITIDNTP